MSTTGVIAILGTILALAIMMGIPILRMLRTSGHTGLVMHRSKDPIDRMLGAGLGITVLGVLFVAARAQSDSVAPLVRWVGIGITLLGLTFCSIAQANMGANWRIGVDKERSTELVRTGLFARIRHPIFLGIRTTMLGWAIAVGGIYAFVLTVLFWGWTWVEARREEAHMIELHGDAYRGYVKTTGRFVPWF